FRRGQGQRRQGRHCRGGRGACQVDQTQRRAQREWQQIAAARPSQTTPRQQHKDEQREPSAQLAPVQSQPRTHQATPTFKPNMAAIIPDAARIRRNSAFSEAARLREDRAAVAPGGGSLKLRPAYSSLIRTTNGRNPLGERVAPELVTSTVPDMPTPPGAPCSTQ